MNSLKIKYSIAAHWGQESASVDLASERILLVLKYLSHVDPEFKNWVAPDANDELLQYDEATNGKELITNSPLQVQAATLHGTVYQQYFISSLSQTTICETIIGTTLGMNPRMPSNLARLSFSRTGQPHLHIKLFIDIFKSMAQALSPQWAALSLFRNDIQLPIVSPSIDGLSCGWMTYLSHNSYVIPNLPPKVEAIHIDTLGSIIIGCDPSRWTTSASSSEVENIYRDLEMKIK